MVLVGIKRALRTGHANILAVKQIEQPEEVKRKEALFFMYCRPIHIAWFYMYCAYLIIMFNASKGCHVKPDNI